MLHSRTFPIEFLANPLPVSETDWPFVKPDDGVAVMVPAAYAERVDPRMTDPTTTRTDAATVTTFARASRPAGRNPAIVDKRDDPFTTHPLIDQRDVR